MAKKKRATRKNRAESRPDRRYHDAESAPMIIGEKRLSFLMREATYQDLATASAMFRLRNVEADPEDIALDDTPSALVRTCVQMMLDLIQSDLSAVGDDWHRRLVAMQEAMRKGSRK